MADTDDILVNPQLRPKRKFMSGYSIFALISLLAWPVVALAGILSGSKILGLLLFIYPIPVIIGVIGEVVVRKIRLPYKYLILDAVFTTMAAGSAIFSLAITLFFIVTTST